MTTVPSDLLFTGTYQLSLLRISTALADTVDSCSFHHWGSSQGPLQSALQQITVAKEPTASTAAVDSLSKAAQVFVFTDSSCLSPSLPLTLIRVTLANTTVNSVGLDPAQPPNLQLAPASTVVCVHANPGPHTCSSAQSRFWHLSLSSKLNPCLTPYTKIN